jgi:hypothetical protein
MRRMGKRSVQRKQAGSVIARHHHAFCGGEDEVACVDQRVIGTVSENAFLIIEQRAFPRENSSRGRRTGGHWSLFLLCLSDGCA